MIKTILCLSHDYHNNPMRNNYPQNQINSSEVGKDNQLKPMGGDHFQNVGVDFPITLS